MFIEVYDLNRIKEFFQLKYQKMKEEQLQTEREMQEMGYEKECYQKVGRYLRETGILTADVVNSGVSYF